MSEVKLDETYWQCDICGDRMSSTDKFWNMKADRFEAECVDAVFTICDKCIKRLREVKPPELLSSRRHGILETIQDEFTNFKGTGDAYFQCETFERAMKWLCEVKPWKWNKKRVKRLRGSE